MKLRCVRSRRALGCIGERKDRGLTVSSSNYWIILKWVLKKNWIEPSGFLSNRAQLGTIKRNYSRY